MSVLPDLPQLPAEYALVRSERAACACHRDWQALLESAGYGPDSDPVLRASTLGGRKPLEELETPRGTLLLRRFSHGGLLRALTGARFADAARPFRELALSSALLARGIATPLVVGARARAAPAGGWYLDLLSLRIEGARDLESLLRAGAAARADFPALVRGAGAFVRSLHEAGLDHVDLTTKNLLFSEAAGAPRFLVLDLDRSLLVEPLPAPARERNLRRLLRFVLRREERGVPALRARDYQRFLAGYEPEAAARRELAHAVFEAQRRELGWHRIGWGVERLLGLPRAP
jgi:3-deoxy-D-manno-octulosonic acid kinase